MSSTVVDHNLGCDHPKSVIERSFLLLDCFRFGENTLTLAELTRRSGLPKPTVHRLANALVDVRALERTSGGFRLDLRMFQLGGLVPRWRMLRDTALPYLCDLYSATHLTAHLSILRGDRVLYLEKIRGHDDLALGSRVGGTLSAHATSSGRVMLAYSPPYVVDEVLAGTLIAPTEHTVTDPVELRRMFADIAVDGYAIEVQEARLGMTCVAAPILNWRREAVASIALSMCVDRDPNAYVPALTSTAKAVSQVLPTAAYL